MTKRLPSFADIAEILAKGPLDDTSLAGGSAGRALLHARLADGDPAQREAAITFRTAGLRRKPIPSGQVGT